MSKNHAGQHAAALHRDRGKTVSVMVALSQLHADAPPKRVGFLGFNGVTTLDLTGPLEAFATAHCSEAGGGCYETTLVGTTSKAFVASSGARFTAQHILRTVPPLDTVIIPGGLGLQNAETCNAIAEWLLGAGLTARRIACVSTGIYAVAPTGLLDGRRVTTHWRHVHKVASTFRQLQVNDCGSFIKDDRFYTSGGGTAGMEMSLALIQEDYGLKTALGVARELLLNLRPPGDGERQLEPEPYHATPQDRLAELPAWISSQLRANLSVEALAERVCLCPRHFSRIFKQTFQSTPADFVERARVTEAARRLSSHRVSVAGVADSVGFRSPDVFRRAFERCFGVAPTTFQKRLREQTASAASPNARNVTSTS